jgi:hypothetical protein
VSILQKILHRAPVALARIAGGFTLVALAMMVVSILVPKPLPIILAMSLGQVVGVTGFGFYFLAVLLDIASRPRTSRSIPPPPRVVEVKRDERAG